MDYPTSPPAGGAHDAAWLDCGVYDEPIRDENAVHDLEHGTVWISYRPDLDDDDGVRWLVRCPRTASWRRTTTSRRPW